MDTLTHPLFARFAAAQTINAILAYDFRAVDRALDGAAVVSLPWAVRQTFLNRTPAYELAYALRNRIGGCVVEANIEEGVTAVGLRLKDLVLDADGLHREAQWEAQNSNPEADFQAMAFPAPETRQPELNWDAFYGDETALMTLRQVVDEIIGVLNL